MGWHPDLQEAARRLATQMSGSLSHRHTDGWSKLALVLPAATASEARLDQMVVTDA
ncbi:MAG: hypothetical protein OEO77_05335 [Acidimicrobiia bacterium]|nr:hypothetical protein [Acidimicrobiia bacterium]